MVFLGCLLFGQWKRDQGNVLYNFFLSQSMIRCLIAVCPLIMAFILFLPVSALSHAAIMKFLEFFLIVCLLASKGFSPILNTLQRQRVGQSRWSLAHQSVIFE